VVEPGGTQQPFANDPVRMARGKSPETKPISGSVRTEGQMADKPPAPQKGSAGEKSATAAKGASNVAGGAADTVPASELRPGLRKELKRQVQEQEQRLDEFHRAAGDVERRIKSLTERMQSAKTKAELEQMRTERQALIEERVKSLGTAEDIGAKWAETKRLLQ